MKDLTCIYILLVLNVVPFRRPRYRTSHCYSELSGDYWDKLSHPTITDIFAGIHAQAQASGKGIRLWRLFNLFGIVYCQFIGLHSLPHVYISIYFLYQLVLFINHVRQILSNMVINKLSMIAAVLY